MNKKLNSEELSYISNQMSIILDSGVTMQEGLEVLLEDVNDKSARSILKFLIEGIEDKKSLYVTMKESKVFPNYFLNMVKIGELTGELDEVFFGLSEYYANEDDMKKSIKNAIFQPVILLIMMFFVVAILVIKIIPAFSEIFSKFNIQVSESFSKTMDFSISTGLTVLIVIAIIISLLLISMILVTTQKGKEMFKVFIDKCIFTRELSKKVSLAKFSSAMTLMIKSSVDTTEALEYVQEVILSKKIKNKIQNCYKCVLDNKGFVESLIEQNIYPSMYNQMLKVSYRTGAYEGTWEKISKEYNRKIDEALVNLVQAIEPIMVTIMTIVIGAILISVMLPLMGIMTSIG